MSLNIERQEKEKRRRMEIIIKWYRYDSFQNVIKNLTNFILMMMILLMLMIMKVDNPNESDKKNLILFKII